MNSFTTAIAASTLALTAASASAAEFPKSGSTKATSYYTQTIVDELEGWEADWQPNVYVLTGILRNAVDGGPFDKNFLRCIGQSAMVAGAYTDSGTCTETDKDSDKIFITYGPDSFTYVGGTGKYKGITGGGTFKADPVYIGKKDSAFIISFEKNWAIK